MINEAKKMKRNRRNKVIFMIIAIVIILITLKMALSVPLTLDYQGILRNSTTNTLMTGNYVFNFSLYNVSNNILLYNEYSTIYVNSGVWNHHIGLTNPLLAGYFSANTYVITAINGQNLTRVNITSVPYSLYSLESNNTQYLNGQASSYYYQSTNPMGFINSTQANSTYTLINSTLNASYILNPPWLTSYVDTNDTVALIALQSKQSADNSSLKSEIDLKYDKTGGNINGNVIINGNLTIFGSVINLTVNNIFANGSYIPDYNALFDIGSSALKYNNGYFVTLYGNLNASYIQNAPWITSYTDTNDTVALIAETNRSPISRAGK